VNNRWISTQTLYHDNDIEFYSKPSYIPTTTTFFLIKILFFAVLVVIPNKTVDNVVDKLLITCGKPVDNQWISAQNLYKIGE
jgi:hypothetical protein